jgi:hypothetical protein
MDQDGNITSEELASASLDAAREVEREAESALIAKMSSKVRVQRWPGLQGPVVGPSLIIMGLTEVAEALAISGFMRPWIVEQIKEHLRSGGEFTNRGAMTRDDEMALASNGQALEMRVKSEYRMATEAEVISYVDTSQYAQISGRKVTARMQEAAYSLHFHEGAFLIEAYDRLPRQARVMLDVLNESGKEDFTEASIFLLLSENADRLNTRQDSSKIWAFYRHRLLEEGHLEEIG